MLDEQRIEEAKNCKDCLGWHKYCKAECCKNVSLGKETFLLNLPGNFLKLKMKRKLTPSEIWYYSLRDVLYRGGFLRFKKERIKLISGEMFYQYTCKKLKGNFCTGHPNHKPEICRDFVLETCHAKGCVLTENCLFKYKLQGGKTDGEKNKKR